jgi:two-component system, chemotaxis family, sensor kinase CheA
MTDANDLDTQILAQMREDFLLEAREILDRLEPALAELERSSQPETINNIFRDVHTLKGNAGFVGLQAFQQLAHKMEDVFSAIRATQLAVTAEIIDIVFAGVQMLSTMIEDITQGGDGEMDVISLIARLDTALTGGISEPSTSQSSLPSPTETSILHQTTLRINVDRLDTLMVLVGELITRRNALLATATRLKDTPLEENAADIARLTNQLQTLVTNMRLMPVERLFNRFVGVTRNLAREQGKLVKLVVEGGDTPIDRTVSEQIYDPLIHLLRNAIGHGLESTADRHKVGKPEESTIRLSAERQGDDAILRIADDGRGIDLARVRQTAVEHGLYTTEEAESLSDAQAMHLIFAPGFSTATTVTDVSGRGVGLDVVAETVRQLRGRIHVESIAGQGTTFVIQLPLVLAIIQVMLVRVGAHTYALPLHIVRETLRVSPESIQMMQQGEVTFIRQIALPVHWLHSWLHQAKKADFIDTLKPAVVVHLTRGDAVLIVDELMGKQQLVIKPLNPYVGTVPGVDGVAILPDGSVTLVLDVEGLAR